MTKRSQIQLLEKKLALLDTELCKAICVDLLDSIDEIPNTSKETLDYWITCLKSDYQIQLIRIKSKCNVKQIDLEDSINSIKNG